MSTLTKEWLQKTIAELEEERDAVTGVVNEDAAMALAAMKLALSSLEAKPVTQVLSSRAGNDTSTIDKALPEGTMLYNVLPAPVSVPDGYRLQPISEYDAMCAAMLQGAELVTTANKLRDAVETIRNSGIEIDAEKIFAERDALNAPVIPDGYCIMPLKLTADNGAKGALCGEFHVQYRIVCQSCVGEGCEDCNHTGGWDAEIPVGWDTICQQHRSRR
ncbi:MAG: hypothetical protein E7H29_15770 [Enterobacter sp.]|nr:hypothetical protein [Enterobacter sp.]